MVWSIVVATGRPCLWTVLLRKWRSISILARWNCGNHVLKREFHSPTKHSQDTRTFKLNFFHTWQSGVPTLRRTTKFICFCRHLPCAKIVSVWVWRVINFSEFFLVTYFIYLLIFYVSTSELLVKKRIPDPFTSKRRFGSLLTAEESPWVIFHPPWTNYFYPIIQICSVNIKNVKRAFFWS